ncbi:MAG: 30S ribosome-binding factor RbfA [Candidatus Margulisiibacteriota bacterium]
MKHRDSRVAEAIQQIVSKIIREEIRYPVTLFSIPFVSVSRDLTHAKIYLSFFGPHPEADFEKVKDAKNFIRSTLARRIQLRKAPEIELINDHSIAEGALMVEKINKLPRPQDE